MEQIRIGNLPFDNADLKIALEDSYLKREKVEGRDVIFPNRLENLV